MLILGLIFALLLLLAATLSKAYNHLPLKELKRRAAADDTFAKALYRPAAYGMNLRLLLGLTIVISASISFLLLSRHLVGWLAFLLVAVLLWLAFIWLPATRQATFSNYLAKLFAPPVAKILHMFHRPLETIGRFIRVYYPFDSRSHIYTKEDLLELIEWQKSQPDNRISADELTVAHNALTFGDKKVQDILTPARMVHVVNAAETISPIIIDELHKSGHSRFPVYEGKKDNIIGTLYIGDLVAAAKKSGTISSLAKRDVRYVHEDFSLHELMEAFLKTHQHIFIVVNSFEEFVGIVTIENLMSQLLAQRPADGFDEYENPRAVAEVIAKKEHSKRRQADIELSEEHLQKGVTEAEAS